MIRIKGPRWVSALARVLARVLVRPLRNSNRQRQSVLLEIREIKNILSVICQSQMGLMSPSVKQRAKVLIKKTKGEGGGNEVF